MMVELTCTAMSEGEGVPYEDPNTKVPVRPEDALALMLAHTAHQASRPSPNQDGSSDRERVGLGFRV